MRRFTAPIFASAAFLLMGASAIANESLPVGDLYVCDEGEPYIQVLMPSDPNVSPVMMLESEQMNMAPVPSGSGARYDLMTPNAHRIVQTKGPGQISYQVDDQPAKSCVLSVAATGNSSTNTAAAGLVSAVGNFSLGGIVRSGPGLNFDRIDSLPFAEPVSLTERTGVMMDGYEWFKIEYSEGLEGYQWGGIMCSKALNIVGLYAPCPAEIQ